jgi:hypothetical protein
MDGSDRRDGPLVTQTTMMYLGITANEKLSGQVDAAFGD